MVESAGAAIARLLIDAGVQRFYSVPGESFLEVLDSVAQDPRARLVSTRHESGAAFMAEADAKLTGFPAVVMATRTVGAANLAIGVHTAHQDSTPMIVVLGQVSTTNLGREAFQEVDLGEFFRPLVKWSTCVLDPGRVDEVVRRAVDAATTGRPGPVLITLPADVSAAPTGESKQLPARPAVPPFAPDDETVRAIANTLLAADRPVVIAGERARTARRELLEFAENFGVGVYSAFRRQDIFPNDDPHYLGHLTLGTAPEILTSLEEADVVLVIGSRLDEVTTQSYRLPRGGMQVLHVDVDPEVLSAPVCPTTPVLSDPRLLLGRLNGCTTGNESVAGSWVEGNKRYREHSTVQRHADIASEAMHPADVIATLVQATPPNAVVANDAGNFSIFLHRYWRYRQEGTQVAPTSGAMGYAVPGAIGAALASGDRPILAVAGDGGFLMTGQEIETAVREGIPIVTVVMRNGLYGTIAMHQRRAFGRVAGVAISDVDIAGFARSLGATGLRARSAEELSDMVATAFASGEPTVIDVPIDPNVLTP